MTPLAEHQELAAAIDVAVANGVRLGRSCEIASIAVKT